MKNSVETTTRFLESSRNPHESTAPAIDSWAGRLLLGPL
jgi:hypothetical protein